mgnify:CR=1 FL=1
MQSRLTRLAVAIAAARPGRALSAVGIAIVFFVNSMARFLTLHWVYPQI